MLAYLYTVIQFNEKAVNIMAAKRSMIRNTDDLIAFRTDTKIRESLDMLKWLAHNVDDVDITSLTDSKFNSYITHATRSLERMRTRFSPHEKSIDPQTEALELYNHVCSAKEHLERVRFNNNPEQYWQRQCELLKAMLSEVSQKINQVKHANHLMHANQWKHEGTIFEPSDERLRPLKAG